VKELYTECEDDGFLANLDEELDNSEQDGSEDETSTLSSLLDKTFAFKAEVPEPETSSGQVKRV
jgi:hypothetical protein